MKRILIAIILGGVCLTTAWGQANADSLLREKMDVRKAIADMAVPEMPGLAVLDAGPGGVLRPTTVRDIAITAANIFTEGGRLPGAFAAELSPRLLAGQTSLRDYQEHPFWYRFRVSVATRANANTGTDLGCGIKMTLLDEQDPRMDPNLEHDLIAFGDSMNALVLACTKNLTVDPFDDPAAAQAAIDSCVNRNILFGRVQQSIIRAREESKKRRWNKPVIEASFGAGAASVDSTVRRLLVARYGGWLSVCAPFWGDWGQLVGSASGFISRGTSGAIDHWQGSGGIRCYLGRNEEKGFIELAESFDADRPEHRFGVGGELNLANGIWASALVNLKKLGAEDPIVQSSLDLHIGLPER